MKKYAGTSLMGFTKKFLIEIIRCLEHNIEVLEERNNNQFKLLIQKEQYAWHDLRKNPEDLPNKNGLYWVHGVWESGKNQEGECEYKVHDGYFSASWNFSIIAWKEIEPFEEVEE